MTRKPSRASAVSRGQPAPKAERLSVRRPPAARRGGAAAAATGGLPTATQKSAARVARHLAQDYPDVTCALENETPFQLLVATILSAQCTDARVNMVTPELFRRWPNAAAMAAAPLPQLEKVIQSTGFFRSKAKNIQGASRGLMEKHNGQVPTEMSSLVELPGVGRKTANVVLGTAFGKATGVVVDTHVARISRRLGLTSHADAEKIEQDLMRLLPQSEWVDFAHRMIHHGRQVCAARKPKCDVCSMRKFCPKIGVSAPAPV